MVNSVLLLSLWYFVSIWAETKKKTFLRSKDSWLTTFGQGLTIVALVVYRGANAVGEKEGGLGLVDLGEATKTLLLQNGFFTHLNLVNPISKVSLDTG